MDLKKIAAILGLAATATEDEVMKKLSGTFQAAALAQKGAADLETELKGHGFKVEAGKLVKLAQDPAGASTPKPEDDAEKLELRKLLSETALSQGRDKITKAKELAAKFVQDGKVPEKMGAELEKLFAIAGRAEALSLSQDGVELVKTPFDAFASLRKVLEAIPAITGEHLSRLPKLDEADPKDADKGRELGRKIADRAHGRKTEAAKK